MEIQINNTPATNDDLVQLKSKHPDWRATTKCRIRAIPPHSVPSTVVLTNPDGRLRFGDQASPTQTVPVGTAWVEFSVSGETGSTSIGDAVIEAHCNTTNGPVTATKGMTVFWFDGHLDLTPGKGADLVIVHNQDIGGGVTGDIFAAPPAHNVMNMSARATIKPEHVDCSAPQIKNLWIGIAQTALDGNSGLITYGPADMKWDRGVDSGTPLTIVPALGLSAKLEQDANDTSDHTAPLYDQPDKGKETSDPNSLQRPMGCHLGAAATSHDTPQLVIRPPGFSFKGVKDDLNGQPVGTLSYAFKECEVHIRCMTWCVVFDKHSGQITQLREGSWHLDAFSTRSANPASVDATDVEPTRDAVLTGPPGNSLQTMKGPFKIGNLTQIFAP